MESRPRLKVSLTAGDKAVEVVGWTSLVSIWILVIVNFASLPDTIPIHYNASGQPDGFGGKLNIIAVPIVATIIFVGLTMLNNYPHIFNYPATLTQENALRHYTNATRLIRYLKTAVVLVFGTLTFITISQAGGIQRGLGSWFLPSVLVVIFVPLAFFIYRSMK